MYIEAYIHDAINLKTEGENKILEDLEKSGFTYEEIKSELDKVDKDLYDDKIEKYINKKLKGNKKSVHEFKRKIVGELINKGFRKEDIPALAVAAFNDVCTGGNPRPTSVEDIEVLYRKAF